MAKRFGIGSREFLLAAIIHRFEFGVRFMLGSEFGLIFSNSVYLGAGDVGGVGEAGDRFGESLAVGNFDGDKTVKLTSNLFDDTSPEIRDGLVVWAGNHDNWDAEIYVWPLEGDPQRLTENEYEDRDPRTAGKRIVWRQERDGIYSIYLASPK